MPGALQGAWRGRGPLACLLWPASLLYRAVSGVHRALFRAGVLRVQRLSVPVVVVGNVIAGGAGKTPVVIALVEHLRQRGIAAGVVSRGYGRRTTGVREVRPEDTAADAGDEPLLVRRRTGAPVFVGERRADAGRALLAAHPEVRVIVSDDGLQHHALARDIELCVFDERGAGNGWLLPAGPLREPWPRQVDFVLHHGDPRGIAGHAIERGLAAQAVRGAGACGGRHRAAAALLRVAAPGGLRARRRAPLPRPPRLRGRGQRFPCRLDPGLHREGRREALAPPAGRLGGAARRAIAERVLAGLRPRPRRAAIIAAWIPACLSCSSVR